MLIYTFLVIYSCKKNNLKMIHPLTIVSHILDIFISVMVMFQLSIEKRKIDDDQFNIELYMKFVFNNIQLVLISLVYTRKVYLLLLWISIIMLIFEQSIYLQIKIEHGAIDKSDENLIRKLKFKIFMITCLWLVSLTFIQSCIVHFKYEMTKVCFES